MICKQSYSRNLLLSCLLFILITITNAGFRTVKRVDVADMVSRASALAVAETQLELNRIIHIDSEGVATNGTFLFITSRDESGNETLIIRVTDPENEKGESILLHLGKNKEEPTCYYFHAKGNYLEKIRGSDFQQHFSISMWALEDLITPPDSELILKSEIDDTVDEEPCSVIRMEYRTRQLKKHSRYSYRKIWISKNNQTPRKTIFYDKKGNPLKTAEFKDFRPVGKAVEGMEIPNRIQLDHHQANTIDIITAVNTVFNVPLPERIFDPHYLKTWTDQDTRELLLLLEKQPSLQKNIHP